jgi:hypothetical protein
MPPRHRRLSRRPRRKQHRQFHHDLAATMEYHPLHQMWYHSVIGIGCDVCFATYLTTQWQYVAENEALLRCSTDKL